MAGKELSVEVIDDNGAVVPFDQGQDGGNKTEVRQFDDDAKNELQKYQSQAEESGRRASELEQQLNEVVRFAQGTINENKRLAGLITNGEKLLLDQAGGRVKAEQASAEAKFKKAYEDGDSAGMLDAQKEIARLANEDAQVRNYVPAQVTPPQQPQLQQPRSSPAPDAKSKGWIDKNADWWMKDKPMTGFALGIHEELIKGGVTPGTDAYIKALDDRMADAFPYKFQGSGGQAPRQRSVGMTVVAPVTRSVGGKSTGKVQITQSMASMARRLGVPVQAYAEELARMNQNVE